MPRILRLKGEGAAPAAPSRGWSTRDAAIEALDEFAKEQRLFGAMKANEASDTFEGILTEHAAALEEIRDQLREALAKPYGKRETPIRHALTRMDEEIRYVRALGADTDERETTPDGD